MDILTCVCFSVLNGRASGISKGTGTSAASLQMFFVRLKSSTPSLQRAVAFSLRIFEFSLMLHKKVHLPSLLKKVEQKEQISLTLFLGLYWR